MKKSIGSLFKNRRFYLHRRTREVIRKISWIWKHCDWVYLIMWKIRSLITEEKNWVEHARWITLYIPHSHPTTRRRLFRHRLGNDTHRSASPGRARLRNIVYTYINIVLLIIIKIICLCTCRTRSVRCVDRVRCKTVLTGVRHRRVGTVCWIFSTLNTITIIIIL